MLILLSVRLSTHLLKSKGLLNVTIKIPSVLNSGGVKLFSNPLKLLIT
jgi:hypothetical protein